MPCTYFAVPGRIITTATACSRMEEDLAFLAEMACSRAAEQGSHVHFTCSQAYTSDRDRKTTKIIYCL